MGKPFLTIGMAVFDDFDGVYFTIQSLRLHHAEAMNKVEFVVIDNNPTSAFGKETKTFMNWVKGDAKAQYIPYTEATGTSAPRNKIFEYAMGEAILVVDPHIMVPGGEFVKRERPNSPNTNIISSLIRHYEENPTTKDILSGPMLYDDFHNRSTHFDDFWRGEMHGIWGTDSRADPFSQNYREEPLDVPGMGLGLFSCRKDAWLGFNDKFRGFGGEEMYIHEKFRRAGGRCLCLPWLLWAHRFGRPAGVKYPLQRWHKVRNYVIGHTELGLSLDPIYEHFVKSGLFSEQNWVKITSNPNDPPLTENPIPDVSEQKGGCGGCQSPASVPASIPVAPEIANLDLQGLYKRACQDTNEPALRLHEFASKVEHITEMGGRRQITSVAILAAKPKKLVIYDPADDSMIDVLMAKKNGSILEHHKQMSHVASIEETDMLFIDTKHTAEQAYTELTKHHTRVKRFIAFHDTQTYGEVGQDKSPGLLAGIRRFRKENPEWSVVFHVKENHGFTVLSKNPDDKPKLPSMGRMALNYSKAWLQHKLSGAKKTTEEEFQARMDTCATCEQLHIETLGEETFNRCSVCGCYLEKTPQDGDGKALWADQDCPLGRWPLPLAKEAV